MSQALTHHQECRWRPPFQQQGHSGPLTFGPACECDDLWTRDMGHVPASAKGAKTHRGLAARLRAENGHDPDLRAFAEAVGAATRREADSLTPQEAGAPLVHDPFCPFADDRIYPTDDPCDQCVWLAGVRADERAKVGVEREEEDAEQARLLGIANHNLENWERVEAKVEGLRRTAAYWEALAENADREWDETRTELGAARAQVSSLLDLLELARQNSTLDSADLVEAPAETTRPSDEPARAQAHPAAHQWTTVEQVRHEVDDLQDENRRLKAEVARLTEFLEMTRAWLIGLEEQRDAAELEVERLTDLVDDARTWGNDLQAPLDEALAEATRLADVLTQRWTELARLEQQNELLADQLDSVRGELDKVESELDDARTQAVQDYVREGAASDGWMTVAQIRQALEQVDADHAAELEATRNARDLAVEAFEGVNMKLEEARLRLEAAPRITDNGRGVPTYYLWENGNRIQLVTLRNFEELDGALTAMRVERDEARSEAVRLLTELTSWQESYRMMEQRWRAAAAERSVADRADLLELARQNHDLVTGERDAVMAELAARPVLHHWECDNTHSLEYQCGRCVALMRAELSRLEARRWPLLLGVGSDEPENGTVVVDASHVAWQRRDADHEPRDPALCWFAAGYALSSDWSAAVADGPVTVLWTSSVGG